MKVHHIPVIIMAIALIVLGLTSFLTDLGINYGVSADASTIGNISTRIDALTVEADELANDTLNFIPEEDDSGFELPYKLLKFGWQGIRTFFVSVLTLGGITVEAANALIEIGVPISQKVISTLLSIIIFVVVSAIFYALYKWKVES